MGTYHLQEASEVGDGLGELSPSPVGSVPTKVSVRTETRCGTPSWRRRGLPGLRKTSHVVSEVLSMVVPGSEGDTRESEFALHGQRPCPSETEKETRRHMEGKIM